MSPYGGRTMNKNYTGIDYFRFIAALLIIAIHTSPLGSFSETGDFMLTRIIARVAVPFFFMTSGFFLISRYTCNAEKLGAFIKKTTLIYGVAILLYIPKTQCPASGLFGMNGSVFLVFAFGFVWKHHFKFTRR